MNKTNGSVADNENQTAAVAPVDEIIVEGVSKTYKGRKVVDNVSLNIRKGEIVGLLGPNGAGKTTTFYMVVGLVKPDKGKVSFNHHDITHKAMYQRARMGVGYLPQEASVFRKLTVKENIWLPYCRPDCIIFCCSVTRPGLYADKMINPDDYRPVPIAKLEKNACLNLHFFISHKNRTASLRSQ